MPRKIHGFSLPHQPRTVNSFVIPSRQTSERSQAVPPQNLFHMCSFPYSLAASRRTEALVTIVSDHCADSVFMPNSAGNPLFLEQVKVALLPLPYYAEFSGEFPFSSPVFNLSIGQLFPTCRSVLLLIFLSSSTSIQPNVSWLVRVAFLLTP